MAEISEVLISSGQIAERCAPDVPQLRPSVTFKCQQPSVSPGRLDRSLVSISLSLPFPADIVAVLGCRRKKVQMNVLVSFIALAISFAAFVSGIFNW